MIDTVAAVCFRRAVRSSVVGLVWQILWLVVASTLPAHARTYYKATLLTSTLQGAGGAFALNDLGQIAGERSLPQSNSRGFFYDGKTVIGFGTLGGENSGGRAVNIKGEVVGVAANSQATSKPFLWKAGVMKELPLPAGATIGVANDINSSGIAVGRVTRPPGQHAVRWDASGYTLLPSLGGLFGNAQAINDAGDIVGYSYIIDFTPPHAFLYRNGVTHDLGAAGGRGSSAFDINNRGEIVGYVDYPDSVRHVMYYANGRMTDIGTLGGPFGSAIAINDAGVAIGDTYSRPTGRIRSFVWKDGLMLDLTALVVPGKDPAFPFNHAIAINNRGEILCSDSNGDYLLTPLEGESQLTNFSLRGRTLPGEQSLVAGFIVRGSANQPMLARAAGPSLAPFGLSAPAMDPSLVLFGPAGELGRNDNWENTPDLVDAIRAAGAFAFAPGSRDAALRVHVPPGSSTLHVTSTSPGSIALAEIYAPEANASFKNFSGRMMAGIGEETAIAGFVVQGTAPKTVLIRAVGPSLTKYGVSNVLSDPRVTVFTGGTIIENNDDWSTTPMSPSLQAAASLVGAFPLDPASQDAAVLVTLPPGGHTVHATGPGDATGVVLLEIYDVL